MRRITAIDTVPTSVAITGTATTSTSDTKTIIVTSSENLLDIFGSEDMFKGSKLWVYSADASDNKLVRVIGCASISSTEYNLTLESPMSGLSSSAIKYVDADLLGYSIINDGGANCTVDGVVVKNGTDYTMPQLAPAGSRITFQLPILVDATGTSVLVSEVR
jgi:hypothetical protein